MNMVANVSNEASTFYLDSYLAPFARWLDADDVT